MPQKGQYPSSFKIDQPIDWKQMFFLQMNRISEEATKGRSYFINAVGVFEDMVHPLKDEKYTEEIKKIINWFKGKKDKLRNRGQLDEYNETLLLYQEARKRYRAVIMLLDRRHMTPERVLVEKI